MQHICLNILYFPLKNASVVPVTDITHVFVYNLIRQNKCTFLFICTNHSIPWEICSMYIEYGNINYNKTYCKRNPFILNCNNFKRTNNT